jgi:flagellar M-ring protein FliF
LRPRTPEALQKIQALVAAAVGLDSERGDHLTVENVPFEEPIVEDEPAPGMWQRFAPQAMDGLRILAILALGLVALLFVARPLARRATTTVTVQAAGGVRQLPRTVKDLEGEIEAQLDAAIAEKSAGNRKVPVLTRRVSELASKEPEHAARLIRMWMAEDGN